MDQNFWDTKYEGSDYHYGSTENRFLKLMLDNRPAGKILLPADGEGRNAVYAAKQGWEVYAFDQSPVAREKALALAEQEGVEIDFQIADAWDYAAPFKFDAIALIFAHFPADLRKHFHSHASQWLKTAGEIWLEAFAPGQLAYTSGGPKNEAMLYTPELISEDFKDLQIRQAEISKYVLNEGPGHQGMGEVLRFRAVRM
ncbi:MAG: SAM-dependent methyltransferase [Bacteroidetes bacterium]|nr:MAG: SAM-dependent methyltransferase [Bacteroidota bacterium]